MAHIEDGVRKGVEQIVADHDPDHLHGLAAAGHGKQQNTRDRQQRRRKQQPRPGLACRGVGAVDDIAHDHVGDGIDDLGNDGEDHQKRPAPDMGQLQNIRVVDVEISSQHGVEQQRSRRAQKIAQPLFFGADIDRVDPALEQRARKQRSRFHDKFLLIVFFYESFRIPVLYSGSIAQQKAAFLALL